MNTYTMSAGQYKTVVAALNFAHDELHKQRQDADCSQITGTLDSLERQLSNYVQLGQDRDGAKLNFKFTQAQTTLVVDALAAFQGHFQGARDTGRIPLPPPIVKAMGDVLDSTKELFAQPAGAGGMLN